MITKLTAENAELYYAPRFAEITAALQATGKNIEIKSLEDYFLYLTDIAELKVGAKDMPNAYLLVLPADEEVFAIDANTRAISVPAFVKKNGIGVYGDHQAEMIVMTIDRYFDHEDFLNDKIVINWNFTRAGEKTPLYPENQAAAAFAPNEELNPGYITFGFIITKDMTPEKGTLTFSVTIYDDKSNDIVYSFNTLTASVAINDTLTLTDMSIVKNETSNYVNRLTNSVYTDNTITPLGDPQWKTGELINNQYTGLDAVAYFKSYEDLNNSYEEGALLVAYALGQPATADIDYKWSFKPVDGTVETARNFVTVNKKPDYVPVAVPDVDPGEGVYFYKEDEMHRIDTTHPIPYAQAKAEYDASLVEDGLRFLPLTVKKLTTIPADENAEDCEFNQNAVRFAVAGNQLQIRSVEELRSFASTNEAQGSGKWVGIDIDTGLETIEGILWGDYELNADDVAEAASVGLGAGHIIFWVKADAIANIARTITLTAPGSYRPTELIVKYFGVDPEAPGGTGPIEVVNRLNDVQFYLHGTSYRATSAGEYQVFAQARIQAGPKYEKVLPGATLKVDTEYFLMGEDEQIDTEHPLVNSDAHDAQERGDQLYVCVVAARNGVPIESSVLSVPPAKKPITELSVESVYQFDDEVSADPDWAGIEYTYISDEQLPVIVATVTIDSEDNRDSAGAFVAELVKTTEAVPTLEDIQRRIDDHDIEFIALPPNGKFTFRPETIQEGEYVARTINRRNGTYSISDNSVSIHTSFVAPAVNNIDVSAVFEDGTPDIPVMIGGHRPQQGDVDYSPYDFVVVDNDNIVTLIINNRTRPSYDFTIVDHSENRKDAQCEYWIEEVEYDTATGVVRPRTPEDKAIDGPLDPQTDVREIELIQDEFDNKLYRFSISQDPGFYRILTKNHYNGTIHTSYTDVFSIVNR